MCNVTIKTFTVKELLRDPLIQMVMRSDGVSEEDLSRLLCRVQEAIRTTPTAI